MRATLKYFHGHALVDVEYRALILLEQIIGQPIPIVSRLPWTFSCRIFGSHVVELNLSHSYLLKLPPELARFEKLEYLNLNNNLLKEIPEIFNTLGSLRHLFLKQNEIQTLPHSIFTLSRLEDLDLSGNHVDRLSEKIGRLRSLRRLLLKNNCLTTLPDSIGSLTNLEKLELQNNDLQDLPRSLLSLSETLEFNLYGNLHIRSTCRNLRDLRRFFNELDRWSIEEIYNSLARNIPAEPWHFWNPWFWVQFYGIEKRIRALNTFAAQEFLAWVDENTPKISLSRELEIIL